MRRRGDAAGVAAGSARIAAADRARIAGRSAGGPDAKRPITPASLAGRRVLAFAGIARPEKFFATLEAMGCRIAGQRAFPDHHPYGELEIAALIAEARRAGAVPVTTEKDAVRLPATLRSGIETLPVAVCWRDEAALDRLLARFY